MPAAIQPRRRPNAVTPAHQPRRCVMPFIRTRTARMSFNHVTPMPPSRLRPLNGNAGTNTPLRHARRVRTSGTARHHAPRQRNASPNASPRMSKRCCKTATTPNHGYAHTSLSYSAAVRRTHATNKPAYNSSERRRALPRTRNVKRATTRNIMSPVAPQAPRPPTPKARQTASQQQRHVHAMPNAMNTAYARATRQRPQRHAAPPQTARGQRARWL